MNESIMRFSSEWFYNNQLESAPEVRQRGILDFDTPMVWIDTSEMEFHEELTGESFGRINKQEANLCCRNWKSTFTGSVKDECWTNKSTSGSSHPIKLKYSI